MHITRKVWKSSEFASPQARVTRRARCSKQTLSAFHKFFESHASPEPPLFFYSHLLLRERTVIYIILNASRSTRLHYRSVTLLIANIHRTMSVVSKIRVSRMREKTPAVTTDADS